MKKRLFAILMTVVLLLLLIPAAVMAEDAAGSAAAETTAAVAATGTCGEQLTWTLDTAGTLTISGTGAMTGYNNVNPRAPWAAYLSSIRAVSIESGVTSIGGWAFYQCTALTDVTMAATVTEIGDSAFEACTGLGSVSIGTGVASIDYGAFYRCTALRTVTIPDSVLTIGSFAFAGCEQLTAVTIPDSVTTIGGSAFNCSGLTAVTIPASVTSIGGAVFTGCTGLGSITVDAANPNYSSAGGVLYNKDGSELLCFPGGLAGTFDIPERVTRIGNGAFSSCGMLSGVTIPDSVTEIGEAAFMSCTRLESVTIPDSVTELGVGAFSGCSDLMSITIGKHVAVIGDAAFEQCGILQTVTFNSTIDAWNAVTIGRYNDALSSAGIHGVNFYLAPDSTQLSWALDEAGTLTISGSCSMPEDVRYYTSVDPIWYDCRSDIKKIVIESGITNIGMYAFTDCSNLTAVTIPDTVTRIGSNAFENCSSLTGVNIPDSVTEIGYNAFAHCSSLSSVILPATGSIGYSAFLYCSSLTAVTIPAGITEIGEGAFGACANLGSIQVSIDSASYMSVGGVLYSRDGKTLLCCPAGMNGTVDIPSYVTSIGDYAFRNCEKLTAVTIPGDVTVIGRCAFVDCTGLTTVRIPAGVTVIGDAAGYENNGTAFIGCTGLKSIEVAADSASFRSINGVLYNKAGTKLICCPSGMEGILHVPDGVTNIGYAACNGCSGLSGVIIPASATEVEDFAFSGCSSLEDVWYGGTEAQWQNILVLQTDDSNGPLFNANLHYNYMTGSPFTDVKDSSEYYYEPVLWAVNNQIVYGIDDTHFAPLDTCTRAQVVAFLYRMAGEPAVTGTNPFTDVQETDWFYDAVLWGCENHIVYGMTDTTFEPYASVTRAQFITFLHRYAGEPAAEGSNPFTDVNAGDWYYDAVVWGAENGIVYGVGDNQFAPMRNCTRGQVVSFIYRYKVG